MNTCSKYPHPDDYSSTLAHDLQVSRIRRMAEELKRRDPGAGFDAMREYVITHIDDLDAIETTLRQTLEGLDAANQRQEETELRNQ